MKLSVSKSFDTRVEKSERVLEVAEAFGLGLTDKKFVVYENLEVELLPGDVVYVTGQSGSGKSLLLRDLATQLRDAGQHVYDIADVPMLDMPLVDQIGSDTNEALALLSQAGVTDAYLFVRNPAQLSDGQKYRFKLAKLIESGAQVWIADEFAAVLDRDTAKVVSYNIAKAARAANAILLVATTHTDLREYLGASVTIEKLYGTRVDVRQYAWSKDEERVVLPPEPEKPIKERKVREKKPKEEPTYRPNPENITEVIRTYKGKDKIGVMKNGKFVPNKVVRDGTKRVARKPKQHDGHEVPTAE